MPDEKWLEKYKKYNKTWDYSVEEQKPEDLKKTSMDESSKKELRAISKLSKEPIKKPYIQETGKKQISPTQIADVPRARKIDPVTGAVLRTILSPAKSAVEGVEQGTNTLIESGKDIAKGDVGTGILGLLSGGVKTAFSAATPLVPVLSAFSAGQQALQEVAPESVNKVVQTALNPITSITEPTTKAGKYAAELGDLVYQIGVLGGISKGSKYFKNIEGNLSFPEKPFNLQLDDMLTVGKEISKQKLKLYEPKPQEGLTNEQLPIKREVQNAIKERQITESNINEYQGTPEIRQTPTETGGGNRPIESGKIQEEIKPLETMETFKEPTGFKNEIINQERLKENKQPIETEVRQNFTKNVWDEAEKGISEGIYDAKSIANDVITKGKQPNSVEVAVLGRDNIQLRNQRNTIQDKILEYRTQGEKGLEIELQDRLKNVESDLELSDKALHESGTMSSDALNIRKALIKEDMSVANFTKQWETKFKKPVPEEILKKVQELELQNRDLSNKLELATATKQINNVVRQTQIRIRREKRVRTQEELSKEWDDLNKQLYITLSKPHAGVPVDAMPLVGKMMVNLVERGVTKVVDIVDTIYEQLKDKIEGLDKRAIMDAISGYGKEIVPKEKSEIDKTIADLRKQMEVISKIEDIEKGVPLKERIINKGNPSKELSDLKKQLKQGMDKYGITEEKNLKTQKTRLRNEILKYREKLTNKDFTEKEKTPVYDKEIISLQGELKRNQEKYKQELAIEERKNWSKTKKAANIASELANLSRAAFQPVGDLSMPFRQGMPLGAGNPKAWTKAWGDMFKALRSEKAYNTLEDAIEFSPYGDLHRKFGLDLTKTYGKGKISGQEEVYAGNWAYKIPLWKHVVSSSERSAVAFMNKLRADYFDNGIDVLKKLGFDPYNPKDFNEFHSLARVTNILSARGELPKGEIVPLLNNIFYSPKMIAGRIQSVAYLANPNISKFARKQMAKSLTSFVGMGIGLLSLAKLSGAEVEISPLSSDFGKIKIGNTRIDIWAGFQQYARFIAQQIMSERKRTDTKKIEKLKPMKALADFARGKLSPQASLIWDIREGKTIIGQEVTALNALTNRITPLAMQDIYEAIREHGLVEGSLIGSTGIFGMGVNTYKNKKR